MKKSMFYVLAWVLLAGFVMLAPKQALAAAKKTVYVVKSIKTKEGSKTKTAKITYNNGFLKKIKEPDDIRTFTYNKAYQLKKYTDKITSGSFKGTTTRTYQWKKGRMVKAIYRESRDSGKDVIYYTYNKKGRVTKRKWVYTGKDENGESFTNTTIYKYKYKNGKISKESGSGDGAPVTTYGYDKKKNLVNAVTKVGGVRRAYYIAKITYAKNGRVKKIKIKTYNPMMKNPVTLTKTITWKKVKVKKKYVTAIKNQQWNLINAENAFDW